MDFESPDVEKDFPGLYASESGRKSNESDFSDGGDHEKPSKRGLLGRPKEKKEKKDRGYAALEGDSSPEEDTDTKSPSKSKKTKSFKFPTKSKEKREKSRDKEKVLEEAVKHKELSEKEKKKEREREKEREKEKKEKEKKEKLREKDKEKEEKAKFKLESKEKLDKKDKTKDKDKEKVKEKEKEKVKEKEKDKGKEKDKEKVKEKDKEKIKEKDKDKKEKKLTKVPSTVTSGVPFEEIFTLGVALPIFEVPLHQSVERSRCHDDTGLPLVVRDSIDYLQAHGLKSNAIYRTEADKIKLQQLRKLYTDRGPTYPYHWDIPVACAILKSFLSELPEPILTLELLGQFEQAAAIAEPDRTAAMLVLLGKLPDCNRSLVGWLVRHFESVVANEQANHVNIQTISSVMGSAMNMSLNLLKYFVTMADKLFPDVYLTKYVPPLLAIPPDFPETARELAAELRKQESLLNQIHAEMHAGFITPARDQQLWEAQRIVTQLKRKLRAVQKSVDPTALAPQPSVEERPTEEEPARRSSQQHVEPSTSVQTHPAATTVPAGDTEVTKATVIATDVFQPEIKQKESPKPTEAFAAEFEDNFEFKTKETKKESSIDVPDSVPIEPVIEKPKLTEKEIKKLRLELENAEYLQLKSLLQAKINSEQFEIVKLRSQVALRNKIETNAPVTKETKDYTPEELELRQRLMKENASLEQKRLGLINQIFQERVACTQLKIELAMKELM